MQKFTTALCINGALAFAVSVVVLTLSACESSYANPTGAQVTTGVATIASSDTTVTIDQSSPKAAINWQSFDIAPNESVRFNQPDANSITLNRVLGQDPSQILGSLSANGQVFVLNPNGVLFGRSAQINVGGLLASTLNMTDQDLLAGRNVLTASATAGSVTNQGTLVTAAGGYVALIAPQVANEGAISAPNGAVALVAGDKVTLTLANGSLLGVTVDQGALNALVENKNAIRADGGRVILSAKAVDLINRAAVNNSGVIEANAISGENGEIRLEAADVTNAGTIAATRIDLNASHDVTLAATSRLSANGEQGGEITVRSVAGTTLVDGVVEARGLAAKGGVIKLLGNYVGLIGTAHVDASGLSGGGIVLVGGDYQGGNAAVQNAYRTFLGADASINVDAIAHGEGGRAIIWADDFTRVLGTITARGGALSGDGGFIETSGHTKLEVFGAHIDTSAPAGNVGTWLLDPSNVDITAAGPTTGSFTGSPDSIFAPSIDSATIKADEVSAALANNNVDITTTNATGSQAGTITVSAPITRSSGSGTTTLTLTPAQLTVGGTITIATGGDISGSIGHPLNVVLAGNGVGASVTVAAPITTFGGDFSSTGTTFTNNGGPITTAGGTININHSSTVTLGSPLSTSGGDIIIAGGSTFTDTTQIDAGTGTVTLRGSSDTLAIGVGSTTGTFDITQAQIADITAANLVIGSSSNTAAIHIGTDEFLDFGTKNVTIQNASGGMIVEGFAVTGSGSLSFNAGAGSFTNDQLINTSGDVSITADQVFVNTDIAGAGKLTIAPFTAATAIQVGIAAAQIDFGTFSFTTGNVASTARILQVGDGTNTGGITVAGSYAPGFSTLYLVTGGTIDIPSAANTITAPNVVLAGSTFNNSGSASIVTPGGRWLIYSTSPAGSTEGGLTAAAGSALPRLYNRTFAANGPETISEPGNHLIYSAQPTLTIAADDKTRIYGDANPAFTYSLSGYVVDDGVTDTAVTAGLAGTPTLTTTSTATSNVGSYAINGATGTLTSGAGYGFGFIDGTLSIEAATLTYVADPVSRAYGDANPAFTGTVTGFQNGETIAAATTGTLTFTTAALTTSNVGSYAIDGSGLTANNGNYLFVQDPGNATALTVTQRGITVTADDQSRLYGQPNPALTYQLTSGTLVNGDTLTGTAATVAIATSNVGNYDITQGSVAANSNYALSFIDGTLSIAAATLTYVADPASRAYGDANPAFTGTVTGFQNGETIASATTGTLAFTSPALTTSNVGSYAIDGSGLTANNGNYLFVQDPGNATALTVTQRGITVTADDQSRLYGQPNPALTYQLTSGTLVNGDTLSGTAATVATPTSNVGNYDITQGSVDAGSNYALSFVDGTLSIAAATLTYVADPASRAYGDANPAFTGTVSGFQNGETIATATTGTLSFTSPALNTSNVGSYAIDGSGLTANNGNYLFVQDPGNATALTVTQRGITVTADDQSRLYGQPNPALTYQLTSGTLVNGDTLTGTAATVATATSNVGNYDITQGSVDAGSNYALSFVDGTLSIAAATLTYVADPMSRVYGDANPAFTGTVTGFQNGETIATATTGTLSFTTAALVTSNVGSYAIDGSGLTANNGNYLFVQDPGNATALTVTQRAITVTADDQSRLYGQPNPALTYQLTSGTLVNGDTLTGTTATVATATSNVGNYDITQGSVDAGSNYALSFVDGTLSIAAATLTYVADPASRAYGDANPAFTGTVTGFQNGETIASATTGTLAFTSPALTTSNVGSYAIDGSGLTANNGNYLFVQDPGNATALTITQRGITVTADDQSRLYGQPNPALTYQLTSGTLVNGDTLTGTTATVATATSNVGNYDITQGSVDAGSNYALSFVDGTLSIAAATLTYVADPASRAYGDANPAFTGTVTGFQNGETIASATTGTLAFTSPALTTSNVGSYAIDGSGLTANNGNYLFVQDLGNATALTVTQRGITVTADDQSRLYGQPYPALTYQLTSGTLVNGDTLSGTAATVATPTSNVGNYDITQGSVDAGSNYALSFVDGTLSIAAATLTYVADPASRAYGDANPAFTGTVSGFQNGETIATATTGTLSFTSPALNTSNVGSYAVDGSGLTANNGNYLFVQDPGNATALTVTQRGITVTADDQSRLYGQPNPALTYQLTSGTLVNGDTLTGTAATVATATSNVGNYDITQGSVDAGSNYALSFVDGTLSIAAATLTYVANPASRAYGDANPAFTGTVTGFQNGETIATATTGTLAFTSPALTTSNVGSYAIDGSGLTANNGNYLFVQDLGNATALTITQRGITVTADDQSRLYGQPNPALTYQLTSGTLVNGDTLTGTATTVATPTSNVGNYDITQGSVDAGSNYALSFVDGTLSIAAATLTYVADPASRAYGDANPAFTGTVTGFQNGETIATATTGTLAFTSPALTTSNVGSYAIDGSGLTANNGNYLFVQDPGNATALTITQRGITVTADDQSRLYGQPNPALTYQLTSGTLVNGDTLTGTAATVATATSNVGNYDITQGSVDAGSNYALSFVDGTLSIAAATLTYVANPASRAYGDANPAFTGTVTGFQNGETIATATTGTLAFTSPALTTSNVGSYAIDGSGLTANNGNYLFVQDPGNATALTITQRGITVTADDQSRLYGQPNPALTYQLTSGTLVNGDTLTGTAATVAIATSNVGNYDITQGSVAANSNYALSFIDGTLSIAAATLTYVADPASRAYGDANPAFTGTVTGFQNGETIASATTGTLAFTSPALTTSNVGSYAIDGSGLTANNGNYLFVQDPGNATALTVTAATLTYVADPASRLYGDANPLFSGTVTGFKNGETIASATSGTLAFTSAALATSNVGSYAIDGSGLTANHSNYLFVQDPGNATALTITPRALTVTADNQSRFFGFPNPLLTYQLTSGTLVNGDTLSGTAATTATINSSVGFYSITQGTVDAGANYALSFIDGVLEITQGNGTPFPEREARALAAIASALGWDSCDLPQADSRRPPPSRRHRRCARDQYETSGSFHVIDGGILLPRGVAADADFLRNMSDSRYAF